MNFGSPTPVEVSVSGPDLAANRAFAEKLKAEISRTQVFKNNPSGVKQVTVGLVGNNLLNEDIRNSVSYTKDVVLMPGLNVRAFGSVKF